MPEGFPSAHEDTPGQFPDEQAPGSPETTEVLSLEDRVEELLEGSELIFASVQGLWQSVSNIYTKIPKENKETGRARLQNDPETGKTQSVRIVNAPQNRKQERDTSNLPPDKVFAHIKHYAHGVAEDFKERGLELYATTPFDELGETVCTQVILQARQDLLEGVREPLTVDGLEFKSNSQGLIEQCIGAFATQAIAIKRLEDMFSDDELAPVLIDRIQELAIEAQASEAEYPGLLETVAIHLATAKSQNEKNYIEQALERVAQQKYTEIDFVQDFFEHGPIDREKRTLRAFVAKAAAAQMIATGAGIDFSDREMATRIAAYFDSDASFADPDFIKEWKLAYKKRVADAIVKQSEDFARHLKPYERGGRRKGRLPPLRPQDDAQPARKRKRQKNASNTQKTDNDKSSSSYSTEAVEDLVEKKRHKPAIFNTMVQTGTTQYELREVGNIDAMMEQPVVTDFLRRHPGENFDSDLRAYLQDIARHPKMNPKVVNNPISLGTNQSRANRLRRYSPMDQAAPIPIQSVLLPSAEVLSDTGGTLSKRIRILYTTTEKNGRSHVGILQISLKDTQTYS